MLRIVDTPLLWATFFLRCVPSVYRYSTGVSLLMRLGLQPECGFTRATGCKHPRLKILSAWNYFTQSIILQLYTRMSCMYVCVCVCPGITLERLERFRPNLVHTLLYVQCVHKVHLGFWKTVARKQIELATCGLRQITAKLWKFFTDLSRPWCGLRW
jgi:hypothetical protein